MRIGPIQMPICIKNILFFYTSLYLHVLSAAEYRFNVGTCLFFLGLSFFFALNIQIGIHLNELFVLQ